MISHEPMVGCMLVAYGGVRHLAEAVSNVLVLSCESLEVAVGDDASCDGAATVVGRFGECVGAQPDGRGKAVVDSCGQRVRHVRLTSQVDPLRRR